MKPTGLLYDERFLKHRTGANHPEIPERLTAIYNGIRDRGLLEHLEVIPAQPAARMWIETVHDRDYVDRFEAACRNGSRSFDSPDNQMCADTFEIALLAVGGVLDMADRVVAGEIDNAFCAVRPPGHHAEKAKAMGFCYFNNVAVAATYLQTQWLIERVAIIDFDVHHGNGTQHTFEDDPTVFYYSIHEHPSFAYPGTGRSFENGVNRGVGYTCNATILPGQGDDFYREVVENELRPLMARFRPQVIIVSTGFDAHVDDDMSDISLSTAGYAWLMKQFMKLGETYADGKVISVLEGGYCLERLPELAADHVQALLQT
ncbi:MAG: histone deacetylase [Desulfosarcina sp.]|nr:histone deacetylase [Desulfobacterales bacterium]